MADICMKCMSAGCEIISEMFHCNIHLHTVHGDNETEISLSLCHKLYSQLVLGNASKNQN